MDASYRTSLASASQRPVLPTIAEGTAIARPLRLAQMVAAVRESRGQTVAVKEQDIVIALEQLCSRGFFVEPTSALAGAALSQLLATGTISADETTVVLLSGSGLKAASKVASLVTDPLPETT